MKIFALFILTIFLNNNCEGEKKQQMEGTTLEYTANSRGFYRKITVRDQSVVVIRDRSGQEMPVMVKISDSDWKDIVNAFQKVDLKSIPTLKAPSEKRFHDGAAIAEITVYQNEKSYKSEAFDHGNPPAEIAALVNKITALEKKD